VRNYKPTGRRPGRPALPEDARRASLTLGVAAVTAEWIKYQAQEAGIPVGRVVDLLAEEDRTRKLRARLPRKGVAHV
jgi:hypothetical protein